MKNTELQKQDNQLQSYPEHTNTYEADGQKFTVVSHFVGKKNINDVMYKYAVNRALNEMLGRIPSIA